jgi:two-component sensor histidine kinase
MTALTPASLPPDLFITDELRRRPPKSADYLQEKLALLDVAMQLGDRPDELLPHLVDLGRELGGAISGGLCLYEPTPAPGVFRWHHLRGYLERFNGGTTPRDFSPCGVTLDADTAILCRRPERTYTWLADAGISLPECLLVPLYIGGVIPVGTLWIVSENEEHFDSTHARTMAELAAFVGIGLRVQESAKQLHRALEHQKTLTREMNHRVKNLFAIVDGMIRVSARTASTPKDMADRLSGRLHALASAHDLVRPSTDDKAVNGRVQLDDIGRTILRPHEGSEEVRNRTEISGPPVELSERTASAVAMVLHELATNAAKYGALACDEGFIRLTWNVQDANIIIHGQECGGPLV